MWNCEIYIMEFSLEPRLLPATHYIKCFSSFETSCRTIQICTNLGQILYALVCLTCHISTDDSHAELHCKLFILLAEVNGFLPALSV